MDKKYARLVDLKHPSYLSKWRNNSLVESDLYKRCWKKKSIVFIDQDYNDVIGICYVQHSVKFQEYGKHGFHIMKLSIRESDEAHMYYESIARHIHLCYDNDMTITWIPEYIWWYKKDDMTKKLHDLLINSNKSNNIKFEIIDKNELYVLKLYHNCNHKFAYLRGKELIEYLKRNEG